MKTHKRNLTICIAAIFLVAGVAAVNIMSRSQEQDKENSQDDQVVASIDTSRIMQLSSTADLLYSPEDPEEVAKRSSNIAIVHIDSVDGTDNYGAKINQPTAPFTYGKMTVLTNLVGTLPEDTNLTFYRLGGIISIDKYLSGLSEGERTKIGGGLKNDYDYVSYKFDQQDIDIEAGKTYLVYLVKDEICGKDENGYEIIGFAGGLREIQTTTASYTTNSDPSNLKVLNNFTGEWEELSDIVEQKS